MSKNSYKPFLATDKEYLKKVAGSIKGAGPIEEIKFELLNDALSALGITEDPYKLLTVENLQIPKAQYIVDEAFRIINTGLSEGQEEAVLKLWDYLCESDQLEKADLIFVFGGEGVTRPKEAARLYKEGWASKILFTGRHASYMQDAELTEAQKFTKIAVADGVPEEDIILENEAINTIENATRSIELLKQLGDLPKRLILIQIAFQSRRAYLTFKAAARSNAWEPELIKYPAPSAKYKRENYFLNKDGWSYVFFEFLKMYGARLMGHF